MQKFFNLFAACLLLHSTIFSQIKWKNVDSLYQPLPASIHIYTTNSKIDTGNFRAFYLVADLKDKKLNFTADTTRDRRITLHQFYIRNNKPLAVVNCTFFSFVTNKNLNVVIKNGKRLSNNIHTINGTGKDTFTYRHPFGSAIGISKKGDADIAWIHTYYESRNSFAYQQAVVAQNDSFISIYKYHPKKSVMRTMESTKKIKSRLWRMKTAVGGGPVLLQEGEINITNNEELKFTGKAINDKHPRTAMGYTKDNKLIILVIEGRNPGMADGATLTQEAEILKSLGCWEALNLDGGGSSCLLVNGKETIKVSDKTGQRPVPAVFLIHKN
jgi:exopolysaccharide biosynthesis protein